MSFTGIVIHTTGFHHVCGPLRKNRLVKSTALGFPGAPFLEKVENGEHVQEQIFWQSKAVQWQQCAWVGYLKGYRGKLSSESAIKTDTYLTI